MGSFVLDEPGHAIYWPPPDHLVERTSLKQFYMSRQNQVIASPKAPDVLSREHLVTQVIGCLVNKVASSSIVKVTRYLCPIEKKGFADGG